MPRPDLTDLRVRPAPSEEARTPATYLAITLPIETRHTLEAWLHLHLAQITTAMQPILTRFQQETDQVEGNMPGGNYPYEGAFRVNYPLTKRKVREIANRIKQAYLDADPTWGVNLDDPYLFQLAIQIEKMLDAAMDYELDEEDDLALACHEAAKHGSGFVVPTWLYHEERIRVLEFWRGWDGQHLETLKGITDFETTYPQWRETRGLRDVHARLNRGEDVEREVTATKVVRNHPDFAHIEAAQMRVYPDVNGYEGLRTTPCYGYVVPHTRFELDAFRDQQVIDAEALARIVPESAGESEEDAQGQQESFEIFKGTIRYQLPGDPIPARYQVWYSVKDEALLRLRAYPWWMEEPDLIPFYVRMEEPGFFKRGIAWDVVDEHTALNVMLNLYLNGIDSANALRLRTKYRSMAHRQLLSRKLSPYNPLVWEQNPNEVDSFPQSMTHLPAIVSGFELLRRNADEGSGTTTLQSGRESPTDPTAPATKTIALLQQAEPNEKDVLRALAPAFDAVGRWALWLYFQGLKLGWIDRLPGGVQIEPELLPELAKQLRTRAMLFDLDRQGRFTRDVQLLTLTNSLIGPTRPDVVLKMLRRVITQSGDDWSRTVDTLDLERAPQVQPTSAPARNGTASADHGAGAPDELGSLVHRLGRSVGVGA